MSLLKVNNITDLGDDPVLTDGVLDVTPPAILQVVQAVKTDTFSTSTSTFHVAPGLAVSITPSSTSSKILVMAQVSAGYSNNGSATYRISGGNATTYVGDANGSKARGVIGQDADSTGFSSNDEHILHSYSMIYLDSPATTSSITYEVQMLCASSVAHVNRAGNEIDNATQTRGASSITVMEVAG